MAKLCVFLLLVFTFGYVKAGMHDNSVSSDEFPLISHQYISQGTLYIPYAEIQEPFTAWVDLKRGRSRIDFYGGMSKTFQLANVNSFGVMRKVVPMTTDTELNSIKCFEVNGTAEGKVSPQSILPDHTGFQYVGMEMIAGENCKKFQLVEKKGGKLNKYSYWLKTEPSPVDPYIELGTPIKYEMQGYNTLLGSHYDHYYLTYDYFSTESPSGDIFQIPQKCGNFPGPGLSHSRTKITFNPMHEFIHGFDDHNSDAFDDFKSGHGKQYKHKQELEKRQNIFRHNFRFIESTNRKGLSYKLGINHLADKTTEEISVLRGKLYTKGQYNGGQPFPYKKPYLNDKMPDSFDWRLYGAVTPVKDQSVCGSCWSFGTIGAIEGANFLKTGNLVRLSQQALVDCSWGYGNNGCDGGEDFRAYQFMMKHGGIPSEDQYGPYLGADGFCHIQNITMSAPITGYVNVTSGDEDALKLAMLKNGPISVAIDASHKTLSFYANGVYYDPQCGSKEENLDHAVLAVGYGTIKGEPYWLVKNSWSTYWGMDGYVLMSRKDNNCGVATTPTYVTM